MNNKAAIKANITASFTSNGVGDITGLVGRTQINDLVDKVYEDIYGLGYIIKGVATSTTNPGALTEKAAYFNLVYNVNTTFTNFAGIIVPSYQLGIFLYDGATWTFSLIATLTPVLGAGDVIDDGGVSIIDDLPVYNSIDGKHIISSLIPKPGISIGSLLIGAGTEVFGSDIMIERICLKKLTGSPSIKIGMSVGADDISGGTFAISDYLNFTNLLIFTDAGKTIYYELSGTGTARIRFEYTSKFFLL
jgi:hypothetical protein